MESALTIGLIAGGVIVLGIIYIYNSLVRLKVQVENAWAQIDVQLKRRYDLIPNLINAVKGYMKHEKGVLEEVTKARTSLMSGSMKDKAKASNQITEALKSIFAVAENYPQLKANENFKMLRSKARTSLMSGSMKDKAKASNQITEALKSIFAVAENYPQLKANENFKML